MQNEGKRISQTDTTHPRKLVTCDRPYKLMMLKELSSIAGLWVGNQRVTPLQKVTVLRAVD
jgi:hypothetical protein